MEGQDWINRKKDMFQTEKKKIGRKVLSTNAGSDKGFKGGGGEASEVEEDTTYPAQQ